MINSLQELQLISASWDGLSLLFTPTSSPPVSRPTSISAGVSWPLLPRSTLEIARRALTSACTGKLFSTRLLSSPSSLNQPLRCFKTGSTANGNGSRKCIYIELFWSDLITLSMLSPFRQKLKSLGPTHRWWPNFWKSHSLVCSLFLPSQWRRYFCLNPVCLKLLFWWKCDQLSSICRLKQARRSQFGLKWPSSKQFSAE